MSSIDNIRIGVMAGFVATVVLSLLMLTKSWVPQLDPVVMLDGIARSVVADLQLPVPMAGWLWHFVIGTLWWGPLFAIMAPILPGRRMYQKGVAFGIGASLLIILMTMPMAGAGYFDMKLSPLQPLVTLLQHIVYGATLGAVYEHLAQRHLSAS